MAKNRSDLSKNDLWSVETIYSSYDDWNEDCQNLHSSKALLQVKDAQGVFTKDINQVQDALDLIFNTSRHIEKIYVYAHLKHDENIADPIWKKAYEQASMLYFQLGQVSSWVEPEILQIPEDTLELYLKSEKLHRYHIYFKQILRLKPYTLSTKEEKILSMSRKSLSSMGQVFSVFNNVDLKFPKIKDGKGEEKELTHGLYSLYLHSEDRILRQNAYETLHLGFKSYENTVSEALHGHIQSHIFEKSARGYNTCLQAALFSNQIDESVYKLLLDVTSDNLDVLHRYVSLRKKALGLNKVHGFDMYVSCVKGYDYTIDFDTAKQETLEAVKPLGKDYCKQLEKGLNEQRWVDPYETKGKRTGGYSSGSYDTCPFILMNYHGLLNDAMTLAHEAGHSMHSHLSNTNQDYLYSHYSIFVAEVASTFNEELLFRHLLAKADSNEEKRFLINQRIDGIKATFFRQTLFAEFELLIHQKAENGEPLTPLLMGDLYQDLNKKYYGDDFCHNDAIRYEYLRIPHFYSNFYVYQYATGICAAFTLVEQVLSSGDPSAYLDFLKAGSSDYPLNVLKKAGADMTERSTYETLIKQFTFLVDELEKTI